MKIIKLYTCLWCWFKTLERVLSEDEFCHLCELQETSLWMEKPFKSPFLNWKTLYDYQQEVLKKIPYKIKEYKKWKKVYIRNNLWKPIDKNKLDKNYDYFPRWKFEEFNEKYPKYSKHHRKLMEEAQKYNPDERVHLDC
jgi:hypothetical protein